GIRSEGGQARETGLALLVPFRVAVAVMDARSDAREDLIGPLGRNQGPAACRGESGMYQASQVIGNKDATVEFHKARELGRVRARRQEAATVLMQRSPDFPLGTAYDLFAGDENGPGCLVQEAEDFTQLAFFAWANNGRRHSAGGEDLADQRV